LEINASGSFARSLLVCDLDETDRIPAIDGSPLSDSDWTPQLGRLRSRSTALSTATPSPASASRRLSMTPSTFAVASVCGPSTSGSNAQKRCVIAF